MTDRLAAILTPVPLDRIYSYRVPDGMELHPGDMVQVPLGPRLIAGVVWDHEPDPVDPAKLRDVERKFDCPPLSTTMMAFVDWVAAYSINPPGMVLKMVLRVPAALAPEPPQLGLVYDGQEPPRMTSARSRVLELAREGAIWSKSGLAHAAGVSPSVIEGLKKAGSFAERPIPAQPVVPRPDPSHAPPTLSTEQREAANRLSQALVEQKFAPVLLEGVTGAGKTEVYFEAIAEVLAAGRQVLVLVPEIALTKTFLDRFEARFGAPPGEWHSDIAPRTRERTWRQVAENRVQIIAGARSSLYLPFRDLGLIVVDEEHDQAYKQEDRVHYNARDMAVVRAMLGDIPVILASATPSVESRVNAETGRYRHIHLKSRFGAAAMPKLSIIDMRKSPPPRGAFISSVLRQAIGETLANGQQSLLFLNRRGYAPLTLCRACGHRFSCNNCSAWLVEHRFRRQLTCHHCGHFEPVPEACPHCGTLDHLVACGPGVERIAEEVDAAFPDARIVVLSSDMAGGVTRLRAEFKAIADGSADIVVGTQLVAKGHNFPHMVCVGVIDADLGLANGDPRAAERTHQLLCQVTGRAGRAGGVSTGFIQTYQPEHPVIQAIARSDTETFYAREIEHRRAAGLPPFGRLVSLIVSARSPVEAETHARAMRRLAPRDDNFRVLGPAEAPMALIRGRYRYRLLVRSQRNLHIQHYVRAWLAVAPKPRGSVRLQIDVDPQSFL